MIAGVVLGAIAAWFLKAWLVMLLFGALHAEVHEAIPAFGFVPTLWIVLFVTVLMAGTSASVSRD